MDAFADSGELYTIRNQFYTNQHHKVRSYSLNQFSPENQLKALEYQIRSIIALEDDASSVIDDGKARFPGNEGLFQLLSAWNDLKSFGTDDSTYFDDVKTATYELQAVLTTLYVVKLDKDIDQAITFLTSYIDNTNTLNKYNEIEPFLILIQLHLVKGNFAAANKIFVNFANFPDSSRDNIIYQVMESWIEAIKGESDNINRSYSLYDELLSSDFDDDPQGKFKLLNVLFVLTIQLKHYPEAQELLLQIKALNQKPNADFIANQITFDYLVNGGANVDGLLNELKSLDITHPLVVDLEEKTTVFNDIVAKYQVEA
ncbi:predicted protein [Scheffersomyces stipitis CBS 6054]|uniref:Coatomer subunit epsilon n=1 Tax=Scheffersomyces stipitis (strain ATCC 58785 / CBS 6054 / NBRC 10063 / NRRL Y-11545) TaxID=322104 RepID=A3LZI0_PICST|nr:predicted protein [Scheffersomyces stipitis CBS 6054]ABN68163.1 predicted protein [Scheffersomyces stipitis CBS 6054]KAG2734478.1 hypothetical protein G9P44_002484 [Scheffersomyces stipitis]